MSCEYCGLLIVEDPIATPYGSTWCQECWKRYGDHDVCRCCYRCKGTMICDRCENTICGGCAFVGAFAGNDFTECIACRGKPEDTQP